MKKPNYCNIIATGAGIFLLAHFWTLAAADGMVKAAVKNDISRAKVSLALAPWAVNCPNIDNRIFAALCEYPIQPPLLWACEENNYELVKLYLEHGANVNATAYQSRYNAMLATLCYHNLEENRFEIAKLLMEHGFDLTTQQDEYGYDSLYASIQIIKGDLPETKAASHVMFQQMVEEFEAKGLNIRKRTYDYKYNIFTVAAKQNHLTAIQFLLENEYYTVNEKDAFSRTALTALLWRGNYYPEKYETAVYLLSQGADPTIRDHDGKSAIDYAEEIGDEQLLSLLNSWQDRAEKQD